MREGPGDVDRIVGVLHALDLTSVLARHLAGDMAWAYALLALTTLPPLVPNSALLVTAGVLAAHGRLDLGLVLLVVAGSALIGDLLIHRGGRALSGPVLSRFCRRPRRRRLLEWTAERIGRYGIPFVVACRFLPSGRVIGGLSAGVVGYPVRRYVAGAGIAEAVWATYSVGIGYLGGRSTGDPLAAIAFGIGVSLTVAGIGGLAQWLLRRRAGDAPAGRQRAGARPPSWPPRSTASARLGAAGAPATRSAAPERSASPAPSAPLGAPGGPGASGATAAPGATAGGGPAAPAVDPIRPAPVAPEARGGGPGAPPASPGPQSPRSPPDRPDRRAGGPAGAVQRRRPRLPGRPAVQVRMVSAYQYGLPRSTVSGGGSRPCLRYERTVSVRTPMWAAMSA